MIKKPKISINVPCYNRIDLLRKCVDSFVNQTFDDFEIIIIDDGSTEDITFVRGIDMRVKFFRQNHLGIAKARNLAIEKSTGKYILIFDSDDMATDKNMLKRLFDTIEENNNYDVVYCDYYKNGNIIKAGNAHEIYTRDEAYNRLLCKQFIPHGSTLWKRDKIIKYDESLKSAVDWQIFLTAFEKGLKFYHIPEALWTYNDGKHSREFNTKRQNDCCNQLLKKRGYYFDEKKRMGIKMYNTNIQGYMSKVDLEWLFNTANEMDSIVEVGSWKGRSTYALLSGCNGVVNSVDHFLGSKDITDSTNKLAKEEDIYEIFMQNVDHFKNLKVFRMNSLEASKKFEDKSVDMVFIDGGHTTEEVEADIKAWLPKTKKMICGHDFPYESVQKAVDNILGGAEVNHKRGGIWFKKL